MAKKTDKTRGNDQSGEKKDLPGYPHYPTEDDIMNPQKGFKKISADEELANSTRLSGRALNDKQHSGEEPGASDNDDLGIVRGTEADVTREDLILLGEREADQDAGDDELTPSARVDASDGGEGDDGLDIPGAELDDREENIGEEDEENNYYSLGGDRHENLEEGRTNDNE